MSFVGDGRVGKNDLSFDGRSWEYRDPNRDSGAIDPQGRGIDTREYAASYYNREGKKIPQNLKYNRNSLDFLDPLYDYSKGVVADAAKKLGIGNIDEKAEVKAILEEIRKPKNEQEKIITKYIYGDDSERDNKAETPTTTVNPHDPIPEVDLQDTDNIYTEGVEPITGGGIGGGGNLNPIQQVAQDNPVNNTTYGDYSPIDSLVDNSVNQTTVDASDNRRFYGGQSNVYKYATNIPNLYKNGQASEASPFGNEGTEFMKSSSNAQDLLASKMGELIFGRRRMFS